MQTIKAWALVNKKSGDIEYGVDSNRLLIGLKRYDVDPDDKYEFKDVEIKII